LCAYRANEVFACPVAVSAARMVLPECFLTFDVLVIVVDQTETRVWAQYGLPRGHGPVESGLLRLILALVEKLEEKLDNRWIVFWKIDLGLCRFLDFY
jgi:hypothetical protein